MERRVTTRSCHGQRTTGPTRTLLAALSLALTLAACSDDTAHALCDAVDGIADAHDEAASALSQEPRPAEAATSYRTLSTRYADAADALDDQQAVESTAEVASLYRQGAGVFEQHDDADRQQFEQLTQESETLSSLQGRMTGGEPLGFSPRAWREIDATCDVAIDPPADR